MENQIGTYKVGIELNDVEGWTQETFARPLGSLLGLLCIDVEITPEGRSSLTLAPGISPEDEASYRGCVERVVAQVFELPESPWGA